MSTETVQSGWIQLSGELVRLQGGAVTSNPQASAQGYDVIVGLIQSNIRGAATDYDVAADQYGSADIQMWDWSSSGMVLASEPLRTRDSGTGMGAMNTFVKDYAAQVLAPGRKILIVNAARGGTGFTLPSTNPQSTTLHWDRTMAADTNNLAYTTATALNSIMAGLPAGSRIVAFLANHGSTDGTNNTPKATFKATLADWIAWLRSQTNTGNVPYVMMQMRPSLRAENRHKNIDDAQQEVAAEGTNIRYVYAPDGEEYNRADSVHFNALGVREIGHRLFTTWNQAAPSWAAPAAETAGAAALGTTNYSIPGSNVVYIATNGNDSNAGTLAAPKATLAAAIAAISTTGTIVVRGGSYEGNGSVSVSAAKTITIQSYPGEAVWFDGSRAATNWTNNGNGTWSTNYSLTLARITSSSWPHADNAYAGLTDQCWVDGIGLQQTADNSVPTAGYFAVNQSADTLTIATNPAGHEVRVSSQRTLLTCGGVTNLLGIGIRRYSPEVIEGLNGAVYYGGSSAGSLIEHCHITDIGVTGITITNTGFTIRCCTIQNCGHCGISAGSSTSYTGGTIANNYIRRINTQKWNAEPTAAGMKTGRSDGLVIAHNYVTDVYGAQGIWQDVSNTRSIVVGNYVDGASTLGKIMTIGIHIEEVDGGNYSGVQYRALCAANTVVGATTAIKILASGYVDVVNNTISGSSGSGGNLYIQQDRAKNSQSTPLNKTQVECPWWTVGNRIINNRIGDGRRQIFMTGNYAAYGICGMDYVDSISGNWFEPRTSGNEFVITTNRSDGYHTVSTIAGWKALSTIGDTSKIQASNTIAAVMPAPTIATPAEAAWATAIGYPVGWQCIGNPLQVPVAAE